MKMVKVISIRSYGTYSYNERYQMIYKKLHLMTKIQYGSKQNHLK